MLHLIWHHPPSVSTLRQPVTVRRVTSRVVRWRLLTRQFTRPARLTMRVRPEPIVWPNRTWQYYFFIVNWRVHIFFATSDAHHLPLLLRYLVWPLIIETEYFSADLRSVGLRFSPTWKQCQLCVYIDLLNGLPDQGLLVEKFLNESLFVFSAVFVSHLHHGIVCKSATVFRSESADFEKLFRILQRTKVSVQLSNSFSR